MQQQTTIQEGLSLCFHVLPWLPKGDSWNSILFSNPFHLPFQLNSRLFKTFCVSVNTHFKTLIRNVKLWNIKYIIRLITGYFSFPGCLSSPARLVGPTPHYSSKHTPHWCSSHSFIQRRREYLYTPESRSSGCTCLVDSVTLCAAIGDVAAASRLMDSSSLTLVRVLKWHHVFSPPSMSYKTLTLVRPYGACDWCPAERRSLVDNSSAVAESCLPPRGLI